MTNITSKPAVCAIALAALAATSTLPMLGATSASAHEGTITTFSTSDRDDLITSFSTHDNYRGAVRVCLVNNGSDREPKKMVLAAGPTNNAITIELYTKFRGSTRCQKINSGLVYSVRFYKNGIPVHTGRFTASPWADHQVKWNWKND